ncbi:DUF421 domain-containing protein [Deinococcus cavernae]|uniref:DUF421 domain-containing protein n=1 Tax=Deinococcus cavernae TaxID=2320857 RepID=A0A418V8R5_9DEIO|nr:DUF421 domain-containing protein [Deinococcus cavernae]RJF72489.1 DUF421 domain-containing protein [Deinococcus cavernae]
MSEAAQKVQPLDWQRMFIGDTDALFLLEIALRTSIIFLWLLFLLRVTGKRGLAQLSPLELAIVIGLGSAAGDPMFYPEVPLLHAMLVLALVVGLQRLLAHFVIHNETIETFVEGTPVELVRDGVILHRGLERAKLSREDLFESLRAEHVRQLGQVQRAYFEQDGHLSVFLHPEGKAPPGLPVVPPWDLELPAPASPGHPGPLACLNCGRVQEAAGTCACGEHHWVAATTDPLA